MNDNTRNAIVRSALTIINDELRLDWSESEINLGRDIQLPWPWRSVLPDILKPYRAKGWILLTYALIDGRNRFIVINFSNPSWTETIASLKMNRKNPRLKP